MANRRMISKSISVSEQVNELSTFAALLFTWMISHADDFGRMTGSAPKIKALVVPMRSESVSDIEQALVDIQMQGLIQWYEVEGKKFIQFVGWDKHQSGLHKRTKSEFPDPPANGGKLPKEVKTSDGFPEIPGTSTEFSVELNRTELNRTEVEEEEKPATTSPDEDMELVGRICVYAANKFGLIALSPVDQEEVKAALREGITEKTIYEGIQQAIASKQGRALHSQDRVKSFKYCAPVIRDIYYSRLKAVQNTNQVNGPPLESLEYDEFGMPINYVPKFETQ